jgi:hypothetical protein
MTVRSDSVVERIMAPWWKNLGVWVYAPVMIIVVSVLIFIYLMQASYVAGQAETMAELEQELHTVKQAISQTRLKIAAHEGVERIRSEARAMGLGEPDHIDYIEVLVASAQPEDQVAYGPGWSPQASSTEGGLFSAALQQFRNWTRPADDGQSR